MNRAQYHAMRRAAFLAALAYERKCNEDGRSSYGMHSIECNRALREATAAAARVPRDRTESRFAVQTRARRARVLWVLSDRRIRKRAGIPWFPADLRDALHKLEVRHV